jgi:hypothetical protein
MAKCFTNPAEGITLELVSRLQRSDVDGATLNGRESPRTRCAWTNPYKPPEQLLIEGRAWLRRMSEYRGQRITLKQHREVLVQAAWVALLVACVEYDTGNRQGAETTRQGALSLGQETDHAEIQGWAHEIRAWMNLTSGDYHGVIAASQAGTEAAPHHGVAVQLAAQEAKAWARIGDRRMTEVALDRGRRLLDAMPYPENLGHRFVVDPTKFDLYAMDCYRQLAEDKMAGHLAEEVLRPVRTSTAPSAHPCATPRPGSPSASSPPAKATSTSGPLWRVSTDRDAQIFAQPGHGQPRPSPSPQSAPGQVGRGSRVSVRARMTLTRTWRNSSRSSGGFPGKRCALGRRLPLLGTPCHGGVGARAVPATRHTGRAPQRSAPGARAARTAILPALQCEAGLAPIERMRRVVGLFPG